MKINVLMLAFHTVGEEVRTRVVDIPDATAKTADSDEELLELVFAFGQNMHQPQSNLESVSVGDVAILRDGSHHMVAPAGWIKLAEDFDMGSLTSTRGAAQDFARNNS